MHELLEERYLIEALVKIHMARPAKAATLGLPSWHPQLMDLYNKQTFAEL
jgi:hypothetical protein